MRLFSLCHNQAGSVAILWAVVLPIVFGFIALSFDVSSWYLTRSELQAATDSAAVAATYSPGFTPKSLDSIASLSMALNGFDRNHALTLTINHPPSQGGYGSTANAVEVIATVPINRVFSILSGTPAMTVRAVGLSGRLVE